MSLSGKRQLFLSKANTKHLIKEFVTRHRADGGTTSTRVFAEQVFELMKKWKGLDIADSYESVNMDPLVELLAMDRDFIRDNACVWQATGKLTLPKTWQWTAEDYQKLDMPSATDTIVSNDMYRRDNRPYTLRVKAHERHFDRDNEGLVGGRSISNPVRGYDMDDVYRTVDAPYQTADTLDAPPNEWRDSSTELMNTSF